MKYNLPILPAVFALAVLSPTLAAPPAEGRDLVAEAARQLAQYPSLEARIRQRVHLYGQHLVGAGAYRQMGEGPDKLLHLDLKLQTSSRAASFLQISDGRFLWTRRETLEGAQLERVDLARIRRALQNQPTTTARDPARVWMALGGLAKLLYGLDRNFDFGPPKPARIGSLPVWLLEGAWKPEKLAQLLPEQKEDLLAGKPPRFDQLPPHLPERVSLVLGRDQAIPLFPYRIEFRRCSADRTRETAGGPADARAAESDAIVAIELFEVRTNAPLDPQQFTYQPGDQEVDDRTDAMLEKLGLQSAAAGRRNSD